MKKLMLFLIACLVLCSCSNSEKPETTENVEMQVTDSDSGLLNTSVSITCVGDCTLATDVNYDGSGSFVSEVSNQNKDYTYFLRNVKKYFEDDDLTIVNFEGTLSENGSRADKTYAFRGDPEYVNILTSSSVEATNLANNHSHDYGTVSMEDTKKCLGEAGLTYFEGSDIGEYEVNGVKIVLVGINALNDAQRESFPTVLAEAKEIPHDLLFVTFHWGVERDNIPNETQVSLAHKAIDEGADLVIGHHPHVLQGIEKYKGKFILYSLGNFCFGGNKNPSDKDTMIYKQTFTFVDGELQDDNNIRVIPCSVSSSSSRNNYQPTPLDGEAKTRVFNRLTKYSKGLSDDIELKFE